MRSWVGVWWCKVKGEADVSRAIGKWLSRASRSQSVVEARGGGVGQRGGKREDVRERLDQKRLLMGTAVSTAETLPLASSTIAKICYWQ